MISRVSRLKGRFGRWKGGKPPLIDAKSPTVFVSMPNPAAKAKITMIAVSPPGNALVIFGRKAMIAIASATSPPKM